MSDNVYILDANNAQVPIATDNVAGVEIQRFKLVLGVTDVDGGNISPTNPVPTTLATSLARTIDSIDTNWYGTPSVTNISCATSSTSLLAANANRKGVILTNTGANPCYIRLDGSAATTSTGYYLASLANLTLVSGYIPIVAIFGITTGGSSNIAIQELV